MRSHAAESLLRRGLSQRVVQVAGFNADVAQQLVRERVFDLEDAQEESRGVDQ